MADDEQAAAEQTEADKSEAEQAQEEPSAADTSEDASVDAASDDPSDAAGETLEDSKPSDDAPIIRELDPNLLSMMTGELANPGTMREKCHQIQLSLAQVFMVLFKDKNEIGIEACSGELSIGSRTELLKALNGEFTYCEASIETWSDDVALYCNNDLLIGVVECLLGGDEPDKIEPQSRTLSDLELSMSKVLFEIFCEALKATITRNPKLEHTVSTPQSHIPNLEDETYKDYHAVDFSISVTFGKMETQLHIVVPQANIIKTDTKAVAQRRRKNREKTEWTEKLSKQVYNSDIVLEANIGLEPMRLNEVGRLQVGDVLRFGEEGEPTVVLKANGHKMYNCALGKAGNKYMVKVTTPVGNSDWKDAL